MKCDSPPDTILTSCMCLPCIVTKFVSIVMLVYLHCLKESPCATILVSHRCLACSCLAPQVKVAIREDI